MAGVNRAWTLASYPNGEPTSDNFAIKESNIPTSKHGEVLVKTLYLSLDPYMRGRMRPGPSYSTVVEPGDVIVGEVVGRVEASESPLHSVGDIVRAGIGWQEYGVVPGHVAKPVNTSLGPISTAVGVLGMPGLTAYFGLLEVCKPNPGDTLVVSAASGAVGGVVGQIGKIAGCNVIGVAGSEEKCDYIVDELGFNSAINYKTQDVDKELQRLAPSGIDCYFDNVGGPVTDAVMTNLADSARVAVCGQISLYNATETPMGPRNFWALIRTRSIVQGFLVYDFERHHEVARARLAEWIKDGLLKYREDIVDGFENAPSTFTGLLRGGNFGKQLIKVAE